MKQLARWAWVAVLGTALALSWWSLDALARHYGMPSALATMVSATFDCAALVAADLAMRRASVADSAAAVKALMLATVSLSAWLNYEHGLLLHYPVAVRVLFASPAVIGGSLFELQLPSQHRTRLHELGRVADPLPRFGLLVWAFHPIAALRRLSQISASRLRSVPLHVIDWTVTGSGQARSPGMIPCMYLTTRWSSYLMGDLLHLARMKVGPRLPGEWAGSQFRTSTMLLSSGNWSRPQAAPSLRPVKSRGCCRSGRIVLAAWWSC
jgi:Protein of unknown function (DUF2637)